jgi:hypothetical protein
MLGNCSLLDKSFNISKSDDPMWTFLQEVHEFKEGKVNRRDWEQALSLPGTLTEPSGVGLAEIRKLVQVRDALIKNELAEFVAGRLHRVDV